MLGFENDSQTWAEQEARKFRAMMRHVEQAIVKAKNTSTPGWLAKIVKGGMVPRPKEKEEKKKEKDFVYCYDEQAQGAYRHKGGAREYSVWDDTQTEMQAPAVAVFADGQKWTCPAITNEEALASKTKQGNDTVVYLEETDRDGNDVALREVKRGGVAMAADLELHESQTNRTMHVHRGRRHRFPQIGHEKILRWQLDEDRPGVRKEIFSRREKKQLTRRRRRRRRIIRRSPWRRHMRRQA